MEKASPFKLFEYKPAAFASASNAAELYQPAVPVLRSVPGFSKKTPIVAASEPNAAAIRDERP